MAYTSATHPLRLSASEAGALMEVRRLENLVADLQDELEETARKSTDLDETRRLLYVALAASRAQRHATLIGTLTNALVHHSGLESDAGTVMERLLTLTAGLTHEDRDDARGWLLRTIDAVNERLQS